jgi:hypothetical protein
MKKWTMVVLAGLLAGAVACDGGTLMAPDDALFAKGGSGNPGKLPTPTVLSATFSGDDLTVTWSAVTGAESYNVVFETPADGIGIPAAPNHQDTVLVRDVSEILEAGGFDAAGYCVKVRANAPAGQGPNNSDFSSCFPIRIMTGCVAVSFDVQPGNGADVDPINLNQSQIPVAIFGSATFDVTKVSVASLRLAGAAVAVKNNGQLHYGYEDVDNDGDGEPDDNHLDLVVHFDVAEMDLTPDTERVYLTGNYNGTAFCEAWDAVRIVPAR